MMWAKYEYDAKGNLSMAEDSNGRVFKLTHDDQDRVSYLKDHKGRWLRFTYGSTAAPKSPTIIETNLGIYVCIYDSQGNLVDSKCHGLATTKSISNHVHKRIKLFRELVAISE